MNGDTRRVNWLLMFGLWGLVFILVWNFLSPAGGRMGRTDPEAEPRPVTARGDLAADERSTIEVFRQASPSVVQITNLGIGRNIFNLDIFEIPQGTGSGFFYDHNGHIVTNFHVIARASEIEVTLADQSKYTAAVVGVAPDRDLAVLKIDAPPDKLKPLPLGTSRDLLVGQKVFAIGNPFGLDQTLTTGVVSALGREIKALTGRKIPDVIQTDAAINPGNSGGPLLDSAGRLIGVNTQIASPSGASAGIGFAVPVDTVNHVVTDIIRHGRVTRPGLGVTTYPDAIMRSLKMRGVLLAEVLPDSAAGKAGLRGTIITRDDRVRQLGDIIIGVDKDAVTNQADLLDALAKHKVGDEVVIKYMRDEREAQAVVKLQQIE